MDAAAKRKTTIDTNRIIAEVAKKLDSDKAELVEHIDAVGAKVDKLKLTRKRKSKYSDKDEDAEKDCPFAGAVQRTLKQRTLGRQANRNRIAGLSMREWRCPVRGQSSPSPSDERKSVSVPLPSFAG